MIREKQRAGQQAVCTHWGGSKQGNKLRRWYKTSRYYALSKPLSLSPLAHASWNSLAREKYWRWRTTDALCSSLRRCSAFSSLFSFRSAFAMLASSPSLIPYTPKKSVRTTPTG
jgi:hypothetical protein